MVGHINGLLLCIILQLIDFSIELHIDNIKVPQFVKTNSSEAFLDCNFRIREWEKLDGFVLKWYLNEVNLVYQWIPPSIPQVIGLLKGRIDRSFRSSKDLWIERRSIRILRPDPSLSGTYTCSVTTFEEEDSKTSKMTVWSPPKSINIAFVRPSENVLNVSCTAGDISPPPEFRLYIKELNGLRRPIPVDGITSIKGEKTGFFESRGFGLVSYHEVEPNSNIGCVVSIKGIHFREKKEQFYIGGLPIVTTPPPTMSPPSPEPDRGAIRSSSVQSSSSRKEQFIWVTHLATIFFSMMIIHENFGTSIHRTRFDASIQN